MLLCGPVCVWGPCSLLLSQDLLKPVTYVFSASCSPLLAPLFPLSLPLSPEADMADSSSSHAEDPPFPDSPWKKKLRNKNEEEKKKKELL